MNDMVYLPIRISFFADIRIIRPQFFYLRHLLVEPPTTLRQGAIVNKGTIVGRRQSDDKDPIRTTAWGPRKEPWSFRTSAAFTNHDGSMSIFSPLRQWVVVNIPIINHGSTRHDINNGSHLVDARHHPRQDIESTSPWRHKGRK